MQEGLISLRSIRAECMARRPWSFDLSTRVARRSYGHSNPIRYAHLASRPSVNAITPTQTSWVGVMAEREGFEPSVTFLLRTLSKGVL